MGNSKCKTRIKDNLPLDNPLNTIKTLLQRLHLGPIAKPHEMMARTIKQISSLARVEIKEDTWDNDDALFETGLEEVQSVGNFLREVLEIQPDVEGRVWDGLDYEAHVSEAFDHIVTFVLFVEFSFLVFGSRVWGG